MNEKANYGNWVPEKALYMLFGAVIVLGVIAVAVQVALSEMVIAIIVGVLCILTLVMAIYMLICHEAFAFGKGNMMAGVHEHLIKHLDWDGEGKLLDIGCGAAALTVHCAKAFPKAQITAMDHWGVEWNYAKEQCEKNAKIEGVADHIAFQKGDAAKLDFPDETFDAVVSNFVFHEVRTAKDKRDVVKEARLYSGICNNTMDDQRDGNYLWEKIGHSQEIVIKYKKLINRLKETSVCCKRGGQIQFNKIGNCEKGEKYAYNIKLRKLMDWNRHDTI